ncbi:glycosyltransferase family 2 protein [Paractinoplanes atraurantiacus]|uniref:Glycosyl transferase family 2 n=1 Tax=Paractinoplanes atraurantiacus TaxID=1036182 RepID=A0A285FVA7_9ACTN|nr:glycosyltransferase family 2 protein [Actinoplanes atraurantiacus]SNY14246.1 Glycosyl transferase family 2 [Actinoplanes atraurantiacus]
MHPLAVAALQARSVAAREPLARAGLTGELARVIALQNLRPDDLATALTMLEGLSDPEFQGLHCQVAYATGAHASAAALLASYSDVDPLVRLSLGLDLGNPHAGGSGPWDLGRLMPSVSVTEGAGSPFDRLAARPAQRTGHPRRITSIVTTHRPDRRLLTAVRSLAGQTWTNQEILVIDDGSPAAYDAVLRQAAALDPRVRLIRMVATGGAYVARNAGLDAATGDFVTFQDADGWSHPARLERQVAPLLADEALFSAVPAGIRVTPELVVTRPGVTDFRSDDLSSLMVRRGAGYFDPIRFGADEEYVARARSVRRLGEALTLIRRAGDDRDDGPVGWIDPARRSYRSAFETAHAQRATGWAAPRRLRGETGAQAYDVVLAGDWTTAGGAGAAGIGQLRALAARGLRAALLQLDVLAHLREGPRNLDPAVQRLINSRELTQVEITDDVRARLVVARTARVLEHAPDLPSGVRAQRVVIEDAAVSEPAAAAALRLFGRRPLWAPAGPDGRRRLAAEAASLDLPGTLDTHQWRLDRRGPRADRPVVGRWCRGGRSEWRRLRAELPDTGRMDVRLLDAAGTAGRSFGRFGPPRSWLVYSPDDVSPRSFLYQIDFYLHLPPDDVPADPDPDVLAALAAGCVAVLPYRYAEAFGDAAVYCAPAELLDTVRMLHGNRRALREQGERGTDFVRRHHAHELYADRVAVLATQP